MALYETISRRHRVKVIRPIRGIVYDDFIQTIVQPTPEEAEAALRDIGRMIADLSAKIGMGTVIGDMVILMTAGSSQHGTTDYLQALERVADRVVTLWAFHSDRTREQAARRELDARQAVAGDSHQAARRNAKSRLLMQMLPDVALRVSYDEQFHRFGKVWVKDRNGRRVRFQPIRLRWAWRWRWCGSGRLDH